MTDSLPKLFGLTSGDEDIHSVELTNAKGAKLNVVSYGATVKAFKIPVESGAIVDVVLGFDTLDSYLKSFDLESTSYFGATVGRFAGGIKNAVFNLNGKTIHLNKNNKNNSLYRGKIRLSQKIWDIKNVNEGENPSITLAYFSPANEENYPVDLSVELTCPLSEENELIIEYKVATTEYTAVNLTHHGYFNIDGHNSDISRQEFVVNSKKMVENTRQNISTGMFLDLAKSPFDFSLPKKCPSKIDNTFIIENEDEFGASLYSNKNNLKMSVYTNQPAVHIYEGGNCINMIKGKENADYSSLSGICFETQNFPDSSNHEHFPGSILRKEEKYYHKSIYKFEI